VRGSYLVGSPRTGLLPQLSVRASADANAVAIARRLLDPKTKFLIDGRPPPPGGERHFIRIDGIPAMWLALRYTTVRGEGSAQHGTSAAPPTMTVSVTISAIHEAALLQVTVSGVDNSYLVAHKMMVIALETLTRLNRR
jgi:hypothetical protein